MVLKKPLTRRDLLEVNPGLKKGPDLRDVTDLRPYMHELSPKRFPCWGSGSPVWRSLYLKTYLQYTRAVYGAGTSGQLEGEKNGINFKYEDDFNCFALLKAKINSCSRISES